MIDVPPPSYEQMIDAISKCDIPRANISIKYEDYLQSDEITVSSLGDLSTVKLRCLKDAVDPYYILTISDPKQRLAFYEEARRLDRPIEKAKALAWLQAKGLADRLPTFDPTRGSRSFAAQVEAACGLKVGSALEVLSSEAVTLKRDFLSPERFSENSAKLECLMNMFTASDAEEKGLRFVFVGNEAFAEEKKK